jgi:hypothetical protein
LCGASAPIARSTNALITAPRDPELLKKLDAIAGRVLNSK